MDFIFFFLQFIVENHAKTLLPQYLGMYRITVNDTETYLVVMRCVFSPRLTIHKKYDLKVRYCSKLQRDIQTQGKIVIGKGLSKIYNLNVRL